uniref:Uncharacterized protein n=1 Tax=Oryza rufipogon TaxID=4529 RepID=A0A0E0N0I9_ORYRU
MEEAERLGRRGREVWTPHPPHPLHRGPSRHRLGSKVSVGEVKLSHKIVPLESLTTRFPLSSSAAVDPSPALMVLVQTVEPLTSIRTSNTFDPCPFTGDRRFADQTTVLPAVLVSQMEKVKACEYEPGYKQMHVGDEANFLPCVIPNCKVSYIVLSLCCSD